MRPDGELVLVADAGERPHHGGGGGRVQGFGQVEQSAPALRLLQGDHPAEAPHQGLARRGDAALRIGGHGAPGGEPQRGLHAGVVQCLDEGDGGGEAPGQAGVGGVVVLVQGEQGDDARDRGQRCVRGGRAAQCRLDRPGERGAVRFGVHRHEHGVGSGRRERRGQVVGRGVVAGGDDQPGAAEGGRGGAGGDGLPGDAVAPRVGLRPFAVAPAVVGQGGQELVEGGRVEGQRGAERVGIAALDGLPEAGVGGVAGAAAQGGGGLGPVAAPLEGVGRQADPPGAAWPGGVENRAPADRPAGDGQFGERGEEPPRAALPLAEGADHGGVRDVECVERLAYGGGHHGVR